MDSKKKKSTRVQQLQTKLADTYRVWTSANRILPEFLIIGAAKCGTTSLYNYLIQHPQILPSSKKEVHYFDYYHHKGLGWYRSHFATNSEVEKARQQLNNSHGERSRTIITGESTPYYFAHPLSPERAFQLLPNAKLLCMLRNPIDRAISSYHNQVRLGIEKLKTFEEAVEQETERIKGHEERLRNNPSYSSYEHKYFAYLRRSEYDYQIESWLKFFPREQLLVINSEDFYANPQPHFQKAIQFLNLDAWEPKTFKVFNASGGYEKMDDALRKKLAAHFRPHNERLFQLLGVRYNWD